MGVGILDWVAMALVYYTKTSYHNKSIFVAREQQGKSAQECHENDKHHPSTCELDYNFKIDIIHPYWQTELLCLFCQTLSHLNIFHTFKSHMQLQH